MRFTINLNGDTEKTFVDNSRRITAAIDELAAALRQAMPHGRNYQCNEKSEEDLALDRSAFINALNALGEIEDLVKAYAKRTTQQINR